MLLQLILAFAGTVFTISSPAPVIFGTLVNEEEYLDFAEAFEKIKEAQMKENCDSILKDTKWDIESRYRIAKRTDKVLDYYWGIVTKSFKYGSLIREKIISTERKKEELEELIEKIRNIYQVLEKTLEHEKEEKKLENVQLQELNESDDYEIIDKEILELENEKEKWQNLLVELENKLRRL